MVLIERFVAIHLFSDMDLIVCIRSHIFALVFCGTNLIVYTLWQEPSWQPARPANKHTSLQQECVPYIEAIVAQQNCQLLGNRTWKSRNTSLRNRNWKYGKEILEAVAV